jgi:hypothetical protein
MIFFSECTAYMFYSFSFDRVCRVIYQEIIRQASKRQSRIISTIIIIEKGTV